MPKKKQATRKAAAIPAEKRFYASDGSVYASLRDLAKGLRAMHPGTYSYHANGQRNDFHNWIRDVFGDKKLAQDVLAARNQHHMARLVEARLKPRR